MNPVVRLIPGTPLRATSDDSVFNVGFAACDDDEAVIEEVWQQLHDRLIAANPVRLGPVQGGSYRAEATRPQLEAAGVPADVLDFIDANPGTIAVVAMVEVLR